MPDSSTRQEDDVRDAFSAGLRDVGRLLRGEIDRRLRPLGLSYLQWATLTYLARAGDGVVQKDLAASLGIDGPSMVGILDRLVKAGLVERREVPADRRFKAVYLTDAAAAVLAQGEAETRALHRSILAGVPREDIETCIHVFRRVAAWAEPCDPAERS